MKESGLAIKRKTGFNRKFAFYFAFSFIVPSLLLFSLLFQNNVSRFYDRLEKDNIDIHDGVETIFENISGHLKKSLNVAQNDVRFIELLINVRAGSGDYSKYAGLGERLAYTSGVDEILIADNKGVLITSRLCSAMYGLKEEKKLSEDISGYYFKIFSDDGVTRLLECQDLRFEMPGGILLCLTAGVFIDEEASVLSSLYKNCLLRIEIDHDTIPLSARKDISIDNDLLSGYIRRKLMELPLSDSKSAEIYAYHSISRLEGIKRDFIVYGGILILIGLFLAVIFGLFAVRPFKRRLEKLLVSMRLASLGETESVRLGDSSGDFFESISGSFNSMVEEIENQHRKLVEAEKVRAWRDIARKMAHEIKNPLTPIRISAETLVKSYDKRKDNFREVLVEKAEIISEEADRIRQVIDEFVEFARLPVIRPRIQDLSVLILATISLYENYDNLEIKTNLCDIESFAFDNSQISRALHNLIKNSVESFEGKPGVILIETGRMSLYNRTSAEIVISDNGPGMPEDIQEKAFTPYFTTKPGGTGLGLLICYNIVLGHNGTIEIDSRPGVGTVTTIRIPIKRERGDEENTDQRAVFHIAD